MNFNNRRDFLNLKIMRKVPEICVSHLVIDRHCKMMKWRRKCILSHYNFLLSRFNKSLKNREQIFICVQALFVVRTLHVDHNEIRKWNKAESANVERLLRMNGTKDVFLQKLGDEVFDTFRNFTHKQKLWILNFLGHLFLLIILFL